MRARILGLALVLASVCVAYATPYEDRVGAGQAFQPSQAAGRNDGAAAFNSGRFATALRLLRPYAEAGDPDAQFKLGTIFEGFGEIGVGAERVAMDRAAAGLWLGRAAEGGSVPAMRGYARLCELGAGVPKDPVVAFRYYASAAERLPEGPAKAAALGDALRLKGSAERYITQFPAGDRQAQALAELVHKVDILAAARSGDGLTASTTPQR